MKRKVTPFYVLCCTTLLTACHKKSTCKYPFQNPDLSVEIARHTACEILYGTSSDDKDLRIIKVNII